ncbi:MAG TPA: hypothetical protein VFB35_02865 [Gaiellaceae bacterium]|nr:hypothetical protein [Gaiellaceae bacterium]
MTRWAAMVAVLGVAAATAGSAQAVGPWPGLAAAVRSASGDVRYTATRSQGATIVKRVAAGRAVASTRIAGAFGIPAVTSVGAAGGLSPDGRLLVLVEPPRYDGLRRESRFVVLATARLSRVATISLPGEFGFDAVSPDRRTLYLIQHVSQRDLIRYVVRAYDLHAGKLLPGAIVDRREPDERMRGYPVARASSPDGSWVYTLYTRDAGSTRSFVHALNAAGRSAFCIDLPAWAGGEDVWNARLELAGGVLRVRAPSGETVARIDTQTLRLV